MSKEIAEEYASSLSDLTVNSKPLINMLTILAEENIDHAGVIVETVEKHLEKVNPDIKLPVLYLVDSIIKNVGGAYTQKFSQSIVNMFTRTFKQVDEKVRSQMFKLRETWHDVFPATKLYQLDVKVNLIDPAWPIQAQPQQSNIHNAPTTSTPAPPTEEEEKMRTILVKKEQELLMLQRKKIEMELEQTRRQLELAEKNAKKVTTIIPPNSIMPAMPVAMVNPVVAPVAAPDAPGHNNVPAKMRLGPPVNKPAGGRIAPVSAALAAARRDPRLARAAPPRAPASPPIAPHVFDIKPLDRAAKRKNVLTIDIDPPADPRLARRDPRLARRDDRRRARPRPDPAPAAPAPAVDPAPDSDAKRIGRLPPIPKLRREPEPADEQAKRRKEAREDRRRRREADASKDSGSSSSPDKKARAKEPKDKERRRRRAEPEAAPEPALVTFNERRISHKERFMRRNKQKSESPEPAAEPAPATNVPEVVAETKDVDLRVLPAVDAKAAPVAQKRPSTELLDGKTKKTKLDKFDVLFGNEDVDLRQLPQVEEVTAPPPPTLTPASPKEDDKMEEDKAPSPPGSPKKDWHEVKEKADETKKTPSKLDLVRAKLAEATKGTDRLGRPLLFSKSPSVERERRRTLSSEDTDLRPEHPEEFDAEDHKKSISIIMSQAKEQFHDGQLDKSQYNTLMYQVLQLNEKLKLKEAKQRESLEISKRKLQATAHGPNNYGDIDERVPPGPPAPGPPAPGPPPPPGPPARDLDLRRPLLPRPPAFVYRPAWRAPRARVDEYVPRPAADFGPRRFRPPYFRAPFDAPWPPYEPRPPPPAPMPGVCQGECPLPPYERTVSPPPLGVGAAEIPPPDPRVLEYVDRDPVKTIQIDGVPREIRFYGETAVIMMDWDDPREIRFLPGRRRVTFDNKDSVVLGFNEPYRRVEVDDQAFDIRLGAPTRELYIDGRWFEVFFGGQPAGVLVGGRARRLALEGPAPQVDVGKARRTDLVAGKINVIVNAVHVCPVYLDARVQEFHAAGQRFTLRFADALRTALINERPFRVEFGDLPKAVHLGGEKYFIRFSALPRGVRPGLVRIEGMAGAPPAGPAPPLPAPDLPAPPLEMDAETVPPPKKSPSPDINPENQGLDMLASVMPSSFSSAPSSASEYSCAEPLFTKPDKIPGLETPADEKPNPLVPVLGNINVNDLFAKLLATGIVQVPKETKDEPKQEQKPEEKPKPKEDKSVIHRVDLLKPETLRVSKQPGLVSRLYGGMQCSGCGARFPPEHTVRYSQHLDWHFRQNRRDRDSARRAHSRHWHYDLSDWLQYEEVEDLEEREKSWFETTGAEQTEAPEPAGEAPSVAAGAPAESTCALCGDAFQQFYNEDKEEWHLRNSVRHDGNNYHPMCLDDYKASLTKEEPPKEETPAEVTVETNEDPIEVLDADDNVDSDAESVVEVVTEPLPEPVEIDEGDEDDVVFKAEPVEEVVVQDDADTDDETAETRRERDRQAQLDFQNVKIKQEPIDPDDEPVITAEELSPQPTIDTTHTTVLSSIDGNLQLDSAPATAPVTGGIRINISKSIPAPAPADRLDDVSADDEPLPPGEEPELEYTLKPALQGCRLSRQPPVMKGNELSGLCSIM